jgi:hypothetical protein
MQTGSVQGRSPLPCTAIVRAASVLVIVMLFVAACSYSPSPGPSASQTLPAATPGDIEQQLSPAPSLADAAAQLAGVLGVSPEAVRVRIRPRGCITCSTEENAAATSLAGIAVAEAAARLQPDDNLWLFVQQLTCMYHFDGNTFTPQGCQLAPV